MRLTMFHSALIACALLLGSATATARAEEMPKGAVVAFDRDTCPTNWKPFFDGQNRVIIGSGLGFVLRQKGGNRQITIQNKNMPSHNHGLRGALNGRPLPWGPGSHPVPTRVSEKSGNIWSEGRGQPITILPPFVALLYCVKT